ncbi:carbohydrate kinase FGGY-like [Firmicutes bacterium CAG:882]|jgi:sugar (pentulose or hexulose) kinase|nr:carbohydrate kinase FGGY-like [Firmicutes bacterium CAG:882]
MAEIKEVIESGRAVLGIEFGSTRIKAVLVDEENKPVAAGSHEWENRFENGVWTYSLDDIWVGLKDCYASLKADVKAKYGVTLKSFAAIGFSAMMHGYMVFDEKGELLVPFRTWRNSITEEAADELTSLFNYNIPQRWSIAHLYQAMLNNEEHLPRIDYMTTLEGFIHWKLTGRRVIGVGEASGMFPIDTSTKNYNANMVGKFDSLIEERNAKGDRPELKWRLMDIMPEVLLAGEDAGVLTEEGATLLDADGDLCAGIPLCPPEGDAGTGMTATNSVAVRTGNVSAGTSVFAMIVMEKELSKVYPEIDLVTTPTGNLVSMVHCNNCTSDLNAWVNIFKEFEEALGIPVDMNKLFSVLYNKALEGDADCGGLMSYGYISGENITHMDEGRPLFVRNTNSKFSLANFMRTHLYTSLGALKIGLDILLKEEGVKVDSITGHGGLFKTKGVGQRFLAAAMDAPITVMDTAGEGGAWGMALLASYMIHKGEGETLDDYLNNRVFAGQSGSTMEPDKNDVKGFDEFIERYKAGLAVERAAVESIMI